MPFKMSARMNEDYTKLIVGLPLFRGFTQHGAQMLLECLITSVNVSHLYGS